VITGAVVRVAQEHGVEVPLLEYTYALLKAVQADIVRARRMGRGSWRKLHCRVGWLGGVSRLELDVSRRVFYLMKILRAKIRLAFNGGVRIRYSCG